MLLVGLREIKVPRHTTRFDLLEHILDLLKVIDGVGGQRMEVWSAVIWSTSAKLSLVANPVA